MSIGNALKFIARGLRDSALRNRLNSASTSAESQSILKEEQLEFSASEFEEAFNHRLIQCQEEEEAEQIQEFKLWWSLLSRALEPTVCESQCGRCSQEIIEGMKS